MPIYSINADHQEVMVEVLVKQNLLDRVLKKATTSFFDMPNLALQLEVSGDIACSCFEIKDIVQRESGVMAADLLLKLIDVQLLDFRTTIIYTTTTVHKNMISNWEKYFDLSSKHIFKYEPNNLQKPIRSIEKKCSILDKTVVQRLGALLDEDD